MRLKQPALGPDSAEQTTLNLIAFLLDDPEQAERLVALTGVGPDDLQSRMLEPEFQAFIFDYALSDEAVIVKFAQSIGMRPEAVVALRARLPGADL